MNHTEAGMSPEIESPDSRRAVVEPLDPRIKSIQPGGGVCARIELAWGRVRRAYLKRVRAGYVARMAELRQGNHNGCPHEVLDSRDLKYFRNQGGYFWPEEHDPFRWRERLPFARDGLAELLLLGGSSAVLTAAAVIWLPYLAWIPALLCGLVLWFFRDPPRSVPSETNALLSPADGTVASIDQLAEDEFIGGPAVRITIFLSIFNAHVNRVPAASRVVRLRYDPGRYLNALRPESADENEQMWVYLQEWTAPYRRFIVRQIAGAIARRIVCHVRPGQELLAGERFGMIKLGSRTVLTFPQGKGMEIAVEVGDRVRAGTTIMARYGQDSRRQ